MNMKKNLFFICSALLLCGCAGANVAQEIKAENATNVLTNGKETNNTSRSTSTAPSTSETDKFVNLSFKDTNDNKAKDKWSSILNSSDNPYVCKETATNYLINEGLKLHQDHNNYVQTTVDVDASYSTVKIDLRGFGNNPTFYLYVNDVKVTPVRVNGVVTVESDGKFNITDTWSTIKYNLASFIGQTVTIKLEIQSGGDAAVGEFYFANTTFSTSDENVFIGSNANDDNAKNAWTNYKGNSTNVYEYYRNDLDIRNEGLDFHINNKDYLTVNDVLVDPVAPKWTIDIRGFSDNGAYTAACQMEVDGVTVIPTVTSGNPSISDSIIKVADGWYTVYYDLTEYSGKRVTVKLSVVNIGDTNRDIMIGGFYFDAADAYIVDAIKYARDFNKDIQQNICKSDGTTNETDLKNAWATYSNRYTALSDEESKKLLNGEKTASAYTDILNFQHNYDEIIRLRGTMWDLDNFMDRLAPNSSINVFNALSSDNNGYLAIAAFVSLLVVSSCFAIPCFIKRRKQQDK